MKKLMFGIAALAACSAMAIESSNIVGYQTIDSNSGTGWTMISPTFLGVNDATGCTLADLKVTGYTGTTRGDFTLMLLGPTGSAEVTAYWVETATVKAGWYANKLGTKALTPAPENVNIVAGRGVWCIGKGLKLQPAGTVSQTAVNMVSNSGTGWTACGNCSPVDLKLSDLSVTGYTGTTRGDFTLMLLGPTGSADVTAYWVETATVKAGWYANKLGTKALTPAPEDIPVVAGRGVWCIGKGLTLVIPPAIPAAE